MLDLNSYLCFLGGLKFFLCLRQKKYRKLFLMQGDAWVDD